MANYEMETIARAKQNEQNEQNVRTKLRKHSPTTRVVYETEVVLQ